MVTITHPYHPLHGQQVEVVRVCRGADLDLVVRLPDGLHVAIAMSWTDYAASSDPDRPFAPPHLLDFDGLCQAVQLIDHIRQEGRRPTVGHGDETCSSADVGYD